MGYRSLGLRSTRGPPIHQVVRMLEGMRLSNPYKSA